MVKRDFGGDEGIEFETLIGPLSKDVRAEGPVAGGLIIMDGECLGFFESIRQPDKSISTYLQVSMGRFEVHEALHDPAVRDAVSEIMQDFVDDLEADA